MQAVQRLSTPTAPESVSRCALFVTNGVKVVEYDVIALNAQIAILARLRGRHILFDERSTAALLRFANLLRLYRANLNFRHLNSIFSARHVSLLLNRRRLTRVHTDLLERGTQCLTFCVGSWLSHSTHASSVVKGRSTHSLTNLATQS